MNPLRRYGSALCLCLAVSLAVAGCGPLLRPVRRQGDVGDAIARTTAAVRADDWDKVRAGVAEVEWAWASNRLGLMLQTEATAREFFEEELGRLKAAMELEDKLQAMLALSSLRASWDELRLLFR
ncbi:MAG: hypothetical protein AB1492_04745 [Bacillota bacterium]